MKHIDKKKLHAPASYDTELHTAHLDEASIAGGAHAGFKARQLFDMVKALPSYNLMKQQLMEDQGYVCCYCNRTIPMPGHCVVTEHVLPVSAHRELAGEYKNLLVSCDGGESLPVPPPGGAPYTRSTYPLHCDKAKKHLVIPVSPFTVDCEKRFRYDPITGKVSGDADVMITINMLNLNHNELKKERKKEIQRWCYDNNGNVLNSDQLSAVFTRMLTPDANGHYHNLYYVVASAALSLVL